MITWFIMLAFGLLASVDSIRSIFKYHRVFGTIKDCPAFLLGAIGLMLLVACTFTFPFEV